jgi:Amt family ammonium transporter
MSSADVTVYEQCYQANDGNEALLLQCITVSFEKMQKELQVNGFDKTMRSFLLVICGGMVFFMQAGFAMVCAGSVRKKNVVNTMLKNLLDACAAAIAFYTIGFGLAYGGEGKRSGTTFAGNENFFGHGVEDFGFWFFQFTFSAASVTIVAGTVAERSKMNAYFCYRYASLCPENP